MRWLGEAERGLQSLGVDRWGMDAHSGGTGRWAWSPAAPAIPSSFSSSKGPVPVEWVLGAELSRPEESRSVDGKGRGGPGMEDPLPG